MSATPTKVSLALAGARASGKSLLLAEIERHLEGLGCVLEQHVESVTVTLPARFGETLRARRGQ